MPFICVYHEKQALAVPQPLLPKPVPPCAHPATLLDTTLTTPFYLSPRVIRNDPSLCHTPLLPDVLAAHGDIEELLEAHLLDTDSLEAKLGTLLYILQNAEASVSLSSSFFCSLQPPNVIVTRYAPVGYFAAHPPVP